jgi:hypothetical protein
MPHGRPLSLSSLFASLAGLPSHVYILSAFRRRSRSEPHDQRGSSKSRRGGGKRRNARCALDVRQISERRITARLISLTQLFVETLMNCD